MVLFSACRDGDSLPGPEITRPTPSGDPRAMQMGFSLLSGDRTGEGAVRTMATAAQYGDIVLIQRTPPWSEFVPGGKISKSTADTTQLEVSLLDQYAHLARFYAIDPTDAFAQRSRIANLPAGVDASKGFADPTLRAAFLEYVSYIVRNYQPDYLAVGVEINMYAERANEPFADFISLYQESYVLAKGLKPDVKVFPTFQLEDLEGTLGQVHPARWETVALFGGLLDALAISTYPYLADISSASELRGDYFSQLKTHYDGEVIIAETAYPSGPTEGSLTLGTEEDQAIYLLRLLEDANANGIGAVVWLAALDPQLGGGTTSVLRDVGLRKADGANKLAWQYWEQWLSRPLR